MTGDTGRRESERRMLTTRGWRRKGWEREDVIQGGESVRNIGEERVELKNGRSSKVGMYLYEVKKGSIFLLFWGR